MSTDGVVVPITLLLEKIIEGRKGQSILACRSTGVDGGFSSWQLVPEFLTRATTFHQKKKPLCEKQERRAGEEELGEGWKLCLWGTVQGQKHQPGCAGWHRRTSRCIINIAGRAAL